ncbi:MAG: undecaprenyl-phosphate glucose phosphotransferase [Planctomycetota bacterium]
MSSIDIRPTRSLIPTLLHACDSVLICAAIPMAAWWTGEACPTDWLTFGLLGSILMCVIGECAGIYRPSRGRSADIEVVLIAGSWGVSLAGVYLASFFLPIHLPWGWLGILATCLVTALLLLHCHVCIRSVVELANANGYMTQRTAIVGFNRLGIEIANNAKRAGDCGMRVIGFFDDRAGERLEAISDSPAPFLGSNQDLLQAIGRGEIDTVLIAFPMRAEKRITGILDTLSNSTVSVYLVPDFFVFELLHSRWTNVGGLPVVSVFETPIYGVDSWAKRIFDIVLGLVSLTLISPIMILCAIAVRYSSPGPIFFRQKRYGLDGKEILVWKFRTMVTCDNGAVVKQATKDDPRVTAVGRILRRTSLDELPQLFNVLAGNMSLVGPRPHATAHNEKYRSLIRGYMMRHKVKPGITGLAQVMGSRGETDTLEKMEYRIEMDHRYIREWSLWLDFKIVLKTFRVVLKQDAY